ncbi:MAG: ABC transporter substrate-binding protein, partial [Candidatus Zixiibacteriota bacterium]
QGYALAAYMFGECRIKSVVALRCSDRYGRMGIMEFRDAATRLGFPLRAELQWKRGDRNFAEQLDKIAEIAPDAVVIWGNTADAAAVVKEIRRRKMSVRIFGSDRMARQEFLEATGEAAEGIVAAASYDPTRQDPKLKGFVKTYTELYGREPEAFAAHAYDGTNILIEAIRKAGLNRARIRDALYELTYYDGVTGPIEFDSTLNDIGPVYIAAVKNGRFVYREMEFAGVPATSVETAPYRTLAQSPPEALSPDDPVAGVEEVIRIGCFLPLDESGRQVIDGIRQAIAEDLHRNPQATPIELVVQDVRGAWGGNSNGLVNLIFTDRVLALVGSTERRGTHLAETLAAKFHFPVLSLCGTDPTITQIPLPWVFCLAQSENTVKNGSLTRQLKQKVETDPDFALGYDAASLLIERIRDGSRSRKELRDALAGDYWHEGLTGTFRFDALGNRIDYSGP